ncbi:ATP-binding protein [Paenibacillus aurantius]|uniref:histidine kinase n=2 Tax=Paenibacillus aurantius TaxID=2918900 RepID=A0AA96RIL7_9BACL|nr:ATP-binding protein [Paenibacillus aurantius]WNQ12329.1 ATP-binding protein [Paenibacillus aurantius]
MAGWLTMVFGVRGSQFTLFDLRVVPLVYGTLFFRRPLPLLLIGAGIAVCRFFISGVNPQSITGALNIMLLGLLAAFLVHLYRRRAWSYWRKALLSIVLINSLQVLGIVAFGAIPTGYYLSHVAYYTYPLGLALSALFVFIIWDFSKERRRADELNRVNRKLQQQTGELQQSKRELEEKARQLVASSRYKSEFIANMSHELKTPLNSIIVLSELIRDQEDTTSPEETARCAGLIHVSGNELLQMINDILDLSRIEAGQMEVMDQPVVLEELLQMIDHQVRAGMAAKGLLFQLRMGEGLPFAVASDSRKINQILRSLLANAVKFTEKGSIALEVSLEKALPGSLPSGAGSGPSEWIVFAVSDTGIGIDEGKQQLIFEAFQQEEGALNRKYGGMGLGLSMSLQLARLLGGSLSLESRKGEGSRFSLRLPARVWTGQPAGPTGSGRTHGRNAS